MPFRKCRLCAKQLSPGEGEHRTVYGWEVCKSGKCRVGYLEFKEQYGLEETRKWLKVGGSKPSKECRLCGKPFFRHETEYRIAFGWEVCKLGECRDEYLKYKQVKGDDAARGWLEYGGSRPDDEDSKSSGGSGDEGDNGDNIHYIHSKTFQEVKTSLKSGSKITKAQLRKLLSRVGVKDDDKMIPIDSRGLGDEFQYLDGDLLVEDMIEKLGCKRASEAFVKAGEYIEAHTNEYPEDRRPREKTWGELRKEEDESEEEEELEGDEIDDEDYDEEGRPKRDDEGKRAKKQRTE